MQTGAIALSLLSQTFPAILLGIYWRRANKFGALAGIISGVVTVIIGMLLPFISSSEFTVTDSQANASVNIQEITQSIGLIDSQTIAFVLFISFFINIVVLTLGSILSDSKVSNPYASTALSTVYSNILFSD